MHCEKIFKWKDPTTFINLCRAINITYINKGNSWVFKWYYFVLPSKQELEWHNLCSLLFFKAVYFESSHENFIRDANYLLYKICFNETVEDPISILNVILPKIPEPVGFAFSLFRFLCFNFHSNYYVTWRVLRVGWGKALNSTRLVKFNHTFLVFWFMGFFRLFWEVIGEGLFCLISHFEKKWRGSFI